MQQAAAVGGEGIGGNRRGRGTGRVGRQPGGSGNALSHQLDDGSQLSAVLQLGVLVGNHLHDVTTAGVHQPRIDPELAVEVREAAGHGVPRPGILADLRGARGIHPLPGAQAQGRHRPVQ